MASKQNHAGSNAGRKVRVVAKIRGSSDPELDSGSSRAVDWVSVNKPQGENSEGVTISFGEQPSSQYFVDYCYEKHEENELIYSREVKPLISAVFEGLNSTIIACGARGSGKTHLIQGSAEKPGLAFLAITELLSLAEKNGKSTAISFYEVDHQEHAVDLLNPEQPPILVYEDRGRIQFKGLTRITLKSVAEFQNLYFTACSAQKAVPKKGIERRSHTGLIVHVFSQNDSKETGPLSKIAFVDLAGYEDTRKKSSDGTCLAEANKINKSIYTLLNVSYALNNNECRVPYRESKLTRMLQDSLRGTSRILMVACLNPSFCQDTIYMASLASRSCQSIHRKSLDPTKKSGNSTQQIMTSHKSQISDSTKKSSVQKIVTSHKSQILDSTKKSSAQKIVTSQKSQILDSTKKGSAQQIVTSHKRHIPKSVSATAKKIHGSISYKSEKKEVVAIKSAMKGRKLFDDASHSAAKAEKEISMAQNSLVPPPDNSLAKAGNHVEPNPLVEKNNSFPDASNNMKLTLMEENDDSSLNASSEVETFPIEEKGISLNGDDHQEVNNFSEALAVAVIQEDHNMNKENSSLMANEDGSPPISSQLRELSNRLKLLYSSTPLSMEIPRKECIALDGQISTDIGEPKTPVVVEQKTPMSVNDRRDIMNAKSPWEKFSMHGSGMKDSIVQEYLRFLNTADKEELKRLKGIGEKRATYILELRDESPEPFKSLDDLKDIGLSAKQIKGIMRQEVGELFN